MNSKSIIYQVLPRSVGNGRFSFWKSAQLKRLKELGISWVWYTGVPRHASGEPYVKGDPGSPYAIENWYDVNPYLAENEADRLREFRNLVRRTHNAGLKVMVDFIPNHVAPDYHDEHGGIPHHDWYDGDWSDTRKVDYSRHETWDRMVDVLLFWAGMGVDGFRCDMVELVPLDFFSYATAKVKAAFPGTIFVGEAYDKGNYGPYIRQGGFDLLYDKSGLYDTLRAIMCSGASAEGITWNWQWLGDLQENCLCFLENHDEQRLASSCFLGSSGKAYAALAVTLLFNRSWGMIYAGQECGESAAASDNGRSSIFNWDKVALSPVLPEYERMMRLAATPLFAEGGNWDLCYFNRGSEGFDPRRHFAFLRYLDGRGALVVCNFSAREAAMKICIPDEAAALCNPAFQTIDINVAPHGAAIIDISTLNHINLIAK